MYNVVDLRRTLKKLPVGWYVKPRVFRNMTVHSSAGVYVGYIDERSSVFKRYVSAPKGQRLKMLLLLLAALIITGGMQGCSYAHYKSDKVEVSGLEFGTTRALEGLRYQKDGATFEIDAASHDSTKGLSLIVEGAVKGAVKGAKP